VAAAVDPVGGLSLLLITVFVCGARRGLKGLINRCESNSKWTVVAAILNPDTQWWAWL